MSGEDMHSGAQEAQTLRAHRGRGEVSFNSVSGHLKSIQVLSETRRETVLQ